MECVSLQNANESVDRKTFAAAKIVFVFLLTFEGLLRELDGK